MAKAPIMPLFTDALIGDTTHLSAEQFGAYVLILIATWRNNGQALPDDEKQLANVCRVSVAKWRKTLRPILQKFFTVSESGWHQQRLEIEWDRVSKLISKRRAFGRAGGRSKTDSKRQSKLTLFAPSKTEPIKDQRESPKEIPNQDPDSDLEGKKGEAAEKQEGNPEGGRCAPLGRSDERPPQLDEDGGGADPPLAAKTRMPARLADRHRDGECDKLPSQAPAADASAGQPAATGEAAPVGGGRPRYLPANQRYLDPHGQNDDNPRQAPAMGSSHGFSPALGGVGTIPGAIAVLGRRAPCRKSPALKLKIRELLANKHARFLTARRRPEELAAYWTAQLDDDPAVAQRAFDEVDHRMRCAGWDDMREWRREQGIGA